jgi:hypothetical protein
MTGQCNYDHYGNQRVYYDIHCIELNEKSHLNHEHDFVVYLKCNLWDCNFSK